MEITGVRVTLIRWKKQKVRDFCTVTFDECFVVKDIKVIAGDKGEFIAMPSRKLSDKCGKCGRKNPVGASYCNSCGRKIPENKEDPREGSLYADVAHPINAECRSTIQRKIIEAYKKALAEDDTPVAEPSDESEPVDDISVAEPADEPEPVDDIPVAELADEPELVDDIPVAELADEPEPVDDIPVAEPADKKGDNGSFSEGIL